MTQPSATPDPRPTGTVRYHNAGRVVLVSGGASGIGAAICREFRKSEARVVCLDLQPAAASEAVDDWICGDVASEADCDAAVAQTVEKYGAIDVLVNNAAIQPPESYVPLDRLPSDLWQRMLSVNFSGYMYLARAVVPQMLRQGSGVIVNLASGQAHRTARSVPAYGPIKAGNLLQTRQWGVEYARQGLRVVSVSPGAIATPLVQASLKAQGGAAALGNRHPIGRIGQPEEVAHAVLWLSSDDASFVTATDLEVDGGLGALGAFAEPWVPAD